MGCLGGRKLKCLFKLCRSFTFTSSLRECGKEKETELSYFILRQEGIQFNANKGDDYVNTIILVMSNCRGEIPSQGKQGTKVEEQPARLA